MTSDVDGGYEVGTTDAGEYLRYAVTVSSSGWYNATVRVSSETNGGTFHLEVDGADKTGPLTVPNTGAWSVYTNVTRPTVGLTAGAHAVRLVMDAVGPSSAVGDFNWLEFTSVAAPPQPQLSVAAVGTNLSLQVSTVVGTSYVLQSTPSLSPTIVWTPVSTNLGTGGVLTQTVPVVPGTPKLFFRYQLQ
jgi:hypothetical protein